LFLIIASASFRLLFGGSALTDLQHNLLIFRHASEGHPKKQAPLIMKKKHPPETMVVPAQQ